MTDNRHLFRLNVGFLINQPIGTSREFHFENPHVHLHPDVELDEFSGATKIGRTPQGLLVQGKFQGRIDAECVRCLGQLQQPLQIGFDELYAFNHRSVSESGLILPEDAHIDLEPLIREYMVLEIPISPLCKTDCKGLCAICGANLNETTCEHQAGEAHESVV